MNVMPEPCCAHYIWDLRLYWEPTSYIAFSMFYFRSSVILLLPLFNELRWEVIVRFIGIYWRNCWPSLFKHSFHRNLIYINDFVVSKKTKPKKSRYLHTYCFAQEIIIVSYHLDPNIYYNYVPLMWQIGHRISVLKYCIPFEVNKRRNNIKEKI